MVDKLRKAGAWLWAVKERLILVVMVCVLANQVYLLLNPAPPEAAKVISAPRAELDLATADETIRPPVPTPPPSDSQGGSYGTLNDRNAFWYYSSQGSSTGTGEIPADLIQLVRIQAVGSKVRAQLKTRTTTKYYDEGDKFEEFELVAIDAAANTATVFVTSYGKQTVLTAQN